MDEAEIKSFHAKARRRRRVIYSIAVALALLLGVVCVWLSAITEKSTTYTRGLDLDPEVRTVIVAAFVLVIIAAFIWRMRKDSR